MRSRKWTRRRQNSLYGLSKRTSVDETYTDLTNPRGFKARDHFLRRRTTPRVWFVRRHLPVLPV